MKVILSGLVAAAIVFIIGDHGSTSQNRCRVGDVSGYAVVTGDRLTGVGGIPPRFQMAQRYFARRYNCTGLLVEVRRLNLGVYDVRFPGNRSSAVVVTVVGGDPVATSAAPVGEGIFRIFLRGSLAGRLDDNRLPLRDLPFTIMLS